MNDLDFLAIVENIRKGLLFLFNSSVFWLFVSFWSMSAVISSVKRACSCSDVPRETKKPMKSWCYDE